MDLLHPKIGVLYPNLKKCMRFSPTDEEAIGFLTSKITGNNREVDFICEPNLIEFWAPWDLKDVKKHGIHGFAATIYSLLITVFGPQESCLSWWSARGIKMQEYSKSWWLFLPQVRNGKRSKRATCTGSWKVTGRPKKIMSDSGLIGKKNFLVFYEGHGRGNKTHWVMHEYCTTLKELDGTHPGQKPFVLCRLSCEQKQSVTDPDFVVAGTAISSCTTAFEVQAEATTTPQIFYVTRSTTIPVDYGDKSFSAHAAENQLGEDAATKERLLAEEMISEMLQDPVDWKILTPSTSLLNRSTGSFPTTANSVLEEFLKFEIDSALASPASDLTKIYPDINFDGTISNAMPLSNCNHVK